MQKAFNRLLSALLILTTLLWLSSYTHHTAIGIDHDTRQKNAVLNKFYRINWNGHGSILVGYGGVWKESNGAAPLEKFDPASVFFKRAGKAPQANSVWNDLGFWYINATKPRPSFWIGIPSWLPVLGLGFILFIRLRATHAT